MNSLFEEAITEDWKRRTDESAEQLEQLRSNCNPLTYRLSQERDAADYQHSRE